jgi:Tol biopolymer transport system component
MNRATPPLLASLTLCLLLPAPVTAQVVERISTPSSPFVLGLQPNANSEIHEYAGPASSADGRFVVFTTQATNLVSGGDRQINAYLKDRQTGAVERLSAPPGDPTLAAGGYGAAISADGRWVAFSSEGDGLVPDDDNGDEDVFLLDRELGTVTLVSRTLGGGTGNGGSRLGGISADGRFVVFVSDVDDLVLGDGEQNYDAFVFDRLDGSIERISVAADGGDSAGDVQAPRISADGRFVCFDSNASDLVAGLTNNDLHIFLRDRLTQVTTLVSRRPDGAPGNGSSRPGCSIADQTGEVAFASSASDLVAGDTNARDDVFIYDPIDHSVERVSLGSAAVQGDDTSRNPSISADGRRIAFTSRASNFPAPQTGMVQDEVYVRDRDTLQTIHASRALDPTQPPSASVASAQLSADGSVVLFSSDANNLVPDDSSAVQDVFAFTLATGVTERVSLAASVLPSGGGGTTGAVSADAQWVAFESRAPALLPGDAGAAMQLLLYQRATRAITLVSRSATGAAADMHAATPVISDDGRYVAFLSRASNLATGGSNGVSQVYLFDRLEDTLRRISSSPDDAPANRDCNNLAMSADGSRIAFTSAADNLLPAEASFEGRLLVWDRAADAIILRADTDAAGVPGNGAFSSPRLSADGRYLVYQSGASNLVADDSNGRIDIFRKDLATGAVLLVSRTPEGASGNGHSQSATVSADGRHVAFQSQASDLVAGDDNGEVDVFVADLQAATPIERVTVAAGGPFSHVTNRSISADGRYVAFGARTVERPLYPDVFVFDRSRARAARASRAPDFQPIASSTYNSRLSPDGGWLIFDIAVPEAVDVPGRLPGHPVDVLLAHSPWGSSVFRNGFEN